MGNERFPVLGVDGNFIKGGNIGAADNDPPAIIIVEEVVVTGGVPRAE